ncbi:MAG: hypothetical protein ACM3SY_15705 [Candidatus Omnitrophota bacterium]
MLVSVSVSLNIFGPLTYRFESDSHTLRPGNRVVVPLGSQLVTGWVIDTNSSYKGRVKNIIGVIKDDYTPDQRFLNFVHAASTLYLTSSGMLLDASLSPKTKSINNFCFEWEGNVEKFKDYSPAELLPLSKKGPLTFFLKPGKEDPIPCMTEQPVVSSNLSYENHYLLDYARIDHYRSLIDECLTNGRSVLIAVPDNLTASYVKEKLGLDADIYNSELKPKEREALWRNYACEHKTGIVIGGLSAVMLPMPNAGLIICERAGSALYKRNYFSPYNIHVLSRLKAEHLQIPVLEGFSSYTVQAYSNRSQLLFTEKREEKGPVNINVHPVPSGTKGIPETVIEAIDNYIKKEKKVLVLLNKKESQSFLFCSKCKKLLKCPSCGGFIHVTSDESGKVTISCRRCGLEKTDLFHCPQCRGELSVIEDISVSSVNKVIKQRIEDKAISSISAEALGNEHIHHVLKQAQNSKIVVSTPVVVNPYFNGIFDAIIYIRPESFFNFDEYDAAERIFSMVSELKEIVKPEGRVDIFSTFHFHYALKSVNDEDRFFERELKYREWFHLPPYANVYHIHVRGKSLRQLGKEMRKVYSEFKERLNIKRIYLNDRVGYRGTFKGTLEAHVLPEVIVASGLLNKKDIAFELMMV